MTAPRILAAHEAATAGYTLLVLALAKRFLL